MPFPNWKAFKTTMSHTIIEIFLGSHGCHICWKILFLSFHVKPFSYNVISIFIGFNCILTTTWKSPFCNVIEKDLWAYFPLPFPNLFCWIPLQFLCDPWLNCPQRFPIPLQFLVIEFHTCCFPNFLSPFRLPESSN